MTIADTSAPRRFYVRFTGWTHNQLTVRAESATAAIAEAATRFQADGYDAIDEIAHGYDGVAVETEAGAL